MLYSCLASFSLDQRTAWEPVTTFHTRVTLVPIHIHFLLGCLLPEGMTGGCQVAKPGDGTSQSNRAERANCQQNQIRSHRLSKNSKYVLTKPFAFVINANNIATVRKTYYKLNFRIGTECFIFILFFSPVQ